jgi:hypothetical protein
MSAISALKFVTPVPDKFCRKSRQPGIDTEGRRRCIAFAAIAEGVPPLRFPPGLCESQPAGRQRYGRDPMEHSSRA